MRHHHLKASISLIALAFASSAWAETPPSGPAPTPDVAGSAAANAPQDVVVVANRSPAPIGGVGESVTVLTLPQLEAQQTLVVSDVLDRTPGISVARNGGVGETTSLFIRGAETDQTLVLIDGVQLNDPSAPGGGFDFADLLIGDISRIEVLRGPQSTLYGSQAIGGVVNIVTADPTKPFQGAAQLEGGTYDTLYGKAGIGGKDGPWTWQVGAGYYNTGGIDAFDQRLGGEVPDSYHNDTVTTRLSYQLAPDASIDARAIYIQARSRFDGFDTPTGNFGDDAEYGTTRETILYSGYNFGLFADRLQNRIAAQYTLTQRDDYDPDMSPSDKTFDGRGTNVRVEYEGSYAIAEGWTAIFGAQSQRESITTSSPAFDLPGTPPTKASDTIDSGYGRLEAQPIHGLNLAAGVRYDDHSTFGGHTVGQASAAWTPNDGQTTFRTSWGQGFKAPSVYELFSIYGDTGLKPEQATGWDAGVEQKLFAGRVDLQATYFQRSTTDLIEFTDCLPNAPCANGFGFYENVAKAVADGVELAGDFRPVHGLDISANYTYLHDKNRSPGPDFNADLARRPSNTANLTTTYVWPVKLSTAIAVRYSGKSYDDDANTILLKGYTLVDLRGSYPLTDHVELYSRVENLFNKAYETAFQFGSPRRAYYGGIRARF